MALCPCDASRLETSPSARRSPGADAIDENAPYQREGAVWSLEQQQLFIDSLLNGYDVPKIYLHDLRGKHPTKVYAIVDGKQRLTTIWRFLRGPVRLWRPTSRTVEATP